MDIALLIQDIASDEGAVREASRHIVYKDHLGNDTVGYGRLLSRGFSQDEAEYLLGNDVKSAMADLDRNAPWWRAMLDPRMRALANMCFQLGWPRLAGFKKMLAALERGDTEEAAKQALDSKWARQTPERAERVAAMIRG